MSTGGSSKKGGRGFLTADERRWTQIFKRKRNFNHNGSAADMDELANLNSSSNGKDGHG